jgi:hypothetical protein
VMLSAPLPRLAPIGWGGGARIRRGPHPVATAHETHGRGKIGASHPHYNH